MNKPVILTGLRANSEFHLGNYLGAILPMVELQRQHAGDYQLNMFVPDLHSFTTPIDHGKLYQQTIDNLHLFAAAGLDLEQPDTFIYRQSYVPAHSELTWILDCFTGYGELSRMTQFKDKSSQLAEENDDETSSSEQRISAGLFNYPVLMVADMLLYGAKWVPVGEDQRQHIELTRDMAIRLNNKFERELFVPPEPWQKQLEFMSRVKGVRIRSLRNPDKKMSKSVEDPAGTIMLSDEPVAAAKKVMGATTDSVGSINLDWETQPGISNLLQMSALLADQTLEDTTVHWQGKSSYGDLKKQVAGQVEAFLTDVQAKFAAVEESVILDKLQRDEAAMNLVANRTLLNVQRAVGLRPA